eukprot:9188802-Pyramimonas_sp.AAC.1
MLASNTRSRPAAPPQTASDSPITSLSTPGQACLPRRFARSVDRRAQYCIATRPNAVRRITRLSRHGSIVFGRCATGCTRWAWLLTWTTCGRWIKRTRSEGRRALAPQCATAST